jgi:hypothetical protein
MLLKPSTHPRAITMPRKAKTQGQAGSPGTQGGETTAGYFRRLFEENPKLLKTRSNAEVLDRWLADHPGNTEVPKSVKVGLQNVKGLLRSKRRRRKASKASAAGAIAAVGRRNEPGVRQTRQNKLETLEERIDDILMYARALDEEGLHDVISLLRRARNEVVWKMGQ